MPGSGRLEAGAVGSSVELGTPVMSAFTVGMAHALAVSVLIIVAAGAMTFIAADTARSRRAAAPEAG
jgi:hypothetical protein